MKYYPCYIVIQSDYHNLKEWEEINAGKFKLVKKVKIHDSLTGQECYRLIFTDSPELVDKEKFYYFTRHNPIDWPPYCFDRLHEYQDRPEKEQNT